MTPFNPDHCSSSDHHRVAEQYLAAARDHFADSTRTDRPPYERTEAAQKCQLISLMAIAQGVLASLAMLSIKDAHGSVEAGFCWDCGYTGSTPTAACPRCGDTLQLRPKGDQLPGREQIIAAHLERMAEYYPASVFAEEGHAPDAIAGTALRTVLTAEAKRLREETP